MNLQDHTPDRRPARSDSPSRWLDRLARSTASPAQAGPLPTRRRHPEATPASHPGSADGRSHPEPAPGAAERTTAHLPAPPELRRPEDTPVSRRSALKTLAAASLLLVPLRLPTAAGASSTDDCYDRCIAVNERASIREIDSQCKQVQTFLSGGLAGYLWCLVNVYKADSGTRHECLKPDCGKYGPYLAKGGSIGSVVVPPALPSSGCPPHTSLCDVPTNLCCYFDNVCCGGAGGRGAANLCCVRCKDGGGCG